jgi:hypothetical protein
MAKSNVPDIRKKIGRPKHPTVPVLVRFEPEDIERLDQWRRHREGKPTRPESVRRLVELGLKAKR